MEVLKIQRDIIQQLQKARINYKKTPKERLTKPHLQTRIQIVENKWKEFTRNHYEIVKREDPEKCEYLKEDKYTETEEFYLELTTELRLMLDKFEVQSATSSEQRHTGSREVHHSSVKLPKIVIPEFSGEYTEWVSFRDLFVSLVHNNGTIDEVQKLHYLKGHLTGEAKRLLLHIPVNQGNYQECWKLLEQRYNNKQFLANNILKQFFSQKSVPTESATALKQLLDSTTSMLQCLSNIGIDTSSWDVIVIYIVSQKLDNETRKHWESKVSDITSQNNQLPNFKNFKEFLENRYHSLEFLDLPSRSSNHKLRSQILHISNDIHQIVCSYCKSNHRISNCKEFLKLDGTNKRNFVQQNRLCFNCLANNHSVKHCRTTTSCQICKRRHHSLLHTNSGPQSCKPSENTSSTHVSQVSFESQKEELPVQSSFISRDVSHYSLLPTALVDARSDTGSLHRLRALIDPASHLSFVTESIVQLLKLKKQAIRENLSGLGGELNLVARSKAQVRLHSSHNPDCSIQVEVYILEKLTGLLPPREVQVEPWPMLQEIRLADPEFNIPSRIDLLLGSDVYGHLLKEGLLKFPSGSLVAQNTIFGWILTGQSKSTLTTGGMVSMHVRADDFIKSFWEIEDEPRSAKRILSEEEQRCEEVFAATTKRDECGRYIVKLPFKNESPACRKGQSRDIATKRFLSLERRLEREPNLKSEYKKVFNEYLNLNHMQLVKKDDYNKGLYLPYHAVVREDKQTTKVRIVFDASCKGSNGVSLNDDLMVGPTLQPELRHIIMNWRTYPICFTADIVKMYRQIRVDDESADYQRILWRDNMCEDICEYKLLRVTFGTSSAPYLAVKVLMQLAVDEGDKYPLAAERVQREFYMDDLMSGCQNEKEAIEIYKQMTGLLKAGGFTLQKWYSNNEKVAKLIQEEESSERLEEKRLIEKNTTNKILGLTWNRKNDEFEYTVQLPPMTTPVTKRKIISDISRLYDPLGWLAPSIIRAKIFIQRLWLSGLGWDEDVSKELLDEWITYREELEQLTNFSIPRWMRCREDDQVAELHGFCDASNAAYGAVVYLRVVDSSGDIHVSLVTAKTRVAPIKQISIPRLELCGGLLLAKLLTEVSMVMNIPKACLHAWTDSEVVLAWLSSHPNKWKTFVGNRVAEIMSHLDRSQWAYVKSEHNPADCASRGIKPSSISTHQLWLNGPKWLKSNQIDYVYPKTINTNLEEKSPSVHVVSSNLDDDDVWSKFSSLTKLLRVLAYCRRFLKRKEDRAKHTYLLKKELTEALNIVIKKAQVACFGEEIENLVKGKEINKRSKLTSLTPYIDELGILRVGGRIRWARVDEHQKHPIIIPHESHLAKLLVADAHVRTLHGGPLLMQTFLRSNYWIIGVKNLVKFHFRKCVTCIRFKAQTNNPLMGQLPAERVTPTRPFQFSGVDYAGPISIRVSKGRGNKSYKGYICLFVCMSTKAIHLEAVSDLSSQGFLSAFKRFVARRGHCSGLYSDNGTNFVGAARDLKVLFAEQNQFLPEISDWLATNGTQWHFIPAHAPNFGGLWEAGIKSTKTHLCKVVGNSTLTFEEMTTLLTQIEACLNSRPISCVQDNDEMMPLTPGHFLVGEPLLLPPDSRYETATISSLRRWQLCQRMLQVFWKRWSQEYLLHMMHRYKWTHATPEPDVGQIVLIKEDGLPPARWLMGRIVEKHPGADKITRVVTLKCKNSLIKRPVSKICILPTTD